MAITTTEFKTRFKEFEDVEDAVLTPRLEDAQAWLSEAAFGTTDTYERAVYYYAAALLVDSPYGSPMGLTQNQASTEVNRYRKIFVEQILPLIGRRMTISGGGLP